jgi:hypothetical protein
MSQVPTFELDVYQNEYLDDGAREVNAIVTVGATGTNAGARATAAEVIIIDCSLSMDWPNQKMRAAKRATAAAIDALRGGVYFAVIAGTGTANVVYPRSGALVAADENTKAAAKRAVAQLSPSGGTAIGSWLSLANTLFAAHPGAIRHAILLTDGKDEGERPADLEAALAACSGNFTCDCRGVGTDWAVSELRKVATALLGTVDIVAKPADLEADFKAMMTQAMGKGVTDVSLRLWTPKGATVRFFKQVAPDVVDLTDKGVSSGPQSADYPTGSWGNESRDYHVCVEVQPGRIGDEMLASRVSVLLAGHPDVLAKGLVRATWTDDNALSTRISPEVAHYTGQAELAAVIQEGLEARKAGDVSTATAKLGRAVALANESGHEGTAKLLAKVVEIDDPVTGTVRLKARVDDADEMALDTRSTKTVRSGKR